MSLSKPSTGCRNDPWRLWMLHKSNFRARGPGKGNWKGEGEKMHLVRKRKLGWSNLGRLVGVRNFPVKEENNKESGTPFQIHFNGDDSKLGIVIHRCQLSCTSGTKQYSSTWASNPTGWEDGNSAGTVQSTSQGEPQPTTWRTSILLAYYLQKRCKTKAKENPLSLDNPMLLRRDENL